MSKPFSQRETGDFALITKADKLATYTVKICTNENNFPKRYRWCITNKMVDSAVEIDRCIHAANCISVEKSEPYSYQLRASYQKKALAESYSLLAMMKVAKAVFGIDSNRIEFWTKQIYTVQNYLRHWIKSDKERYGKI